MEYRNFIIQPGDFSYTYVHKNYNGPEDKRTGFVKSAQDAKNVIDEIYFAQTHYRVSTVGKYGVNIHKFAYWEEATRFCNKMGIDYMNIETYVLGERVNFDSF